VYIFEDQKDYNCYIEQSTMMVNHGRSEMCDFIGREPSIVKEQVTEWNYEDSEFIAKHRTTSDILIVIDNTQYLKPFSNMLRVGDPKDVTYTLQI